MGEERWCGETAVSVIQRQGRRHREREESCGDVTLIRREKDHLFLGLADGQSGAVYGAEGGMACLASVADYVKAMGIRRVLDAPFPDELPYEIVKGYRRKLLMLAEDRGAEFRDFASTLLALAVDWESGEYVLFHLGDGCAVSVSGAGEAAVFSVPDAGVAAHSTWLTTSAAAIPHLRLSFGSLAKKKRVLLLSDGAGCLCAGRHIPRQSKELLCGETSEIEAYLTRMDPADDASCLILDWLSGAAK